MTDSAVAYVKELERRLYEQGQARVLSRDDDGVVRFSTVRLGSDGGTTLISEGSPDPPTNLGLTPGATFNEIWVDASWTASANAVEYYVLLVRNGNIEQTRTVATTSLRIVGLVPNVTYEVRVHSVDAISRVSNPLSDTFMSIGDTDAPPQVVGLTVTAGVRSVLAKWDESTAPDVKDGNGIYELQIDTVNTFNSGNLRTARTSGTLASWTDLEGDTEYFVRVRAIDSSGNAGVFSSVASATTATAESRDFTVDPIQSTEIADEAILTPHLSANIINASHLITDTAVITTSAQMAEAIINSAHIIELDAALVTFGTMSGDRISANTLDVNTLKSSTFSAGTITLAADGLLQAGNATDGVLFDGEGIRMFSGGVLAVNLPRVGDASFRGTIHAEEGTIGSLSVTGNLQVGSAGNIDTGSPGQVIRLRISRNNLVSNTSDIRWIDGADNQISRLVGFDTGTIRFEVGNNFFVQAEGFVTIEGNGGNIHLDPASGSSVFIRNGATLRMSGSSGTASSVLVGLNGANHGLYVPGAAEVGISAAGNLAMTLRGVSGGRVCGIPFADGDQGSTTRRFSWTVTNTFTQATHVATNQTEGSPLVRWIRRGTPIDGFIMSFRRGTTTVGSITIGAGVTNFNTSSDRSLKKDIVAMDNEEALQRLMELQPRKYRWRERQVSIDDPVDKEIHEGLIADEVIEFLPDAVTVSEDEPMMIDYSKFVPLIISAIQSLKEKVDVLEVS